MSKEPVTISNNDKEKKAIEDKDLVAVIIEGIDSEAMFKKLVDTVGYDKITDRRVLIADILDAQRALEGCKGNDEEKIKEMAVRAVNIHKRLPPFNKCLCIKDGITFYLLVNKVESIALEMKQDEDKEKENKTSKPDIDAKTSPIYQ